jgi:ribosomal-protein-alanine N-acetyltransferase
MSSAGLCVRSAGGADLPGVIALERATAEAPHWAEAEYGSIVQEKGEVNGVRRCFFVAERDDAVVGFAVGKVAGRGTESVAELESVAVAISARRLGVGRTLCEAVAAWCQEQGAAALELEVRAASEGAVALYRGLGFVAVGRRRGYYSDPADDAVLMRLELAGGV